MSAAANSNAPNDNHAVRILQEPQVDLLTFDQRLETQLEQVLASIAEVVTADVGYISLLRKDSRFISPTVTFGVPPKAVPALEIGHGGLSGWVYRNRESYNWPGGPCDDHYVPYRDSKLEIKNELVTPMRYAGQVIGFLTVSSIRQNTFTQSTEQFLQTVADEIALVIQNRRFYEASLRLSQVFFPDLTPKSVAQSLAEAANQIMDTPVTCVWLREQQEDHEVLVLKGWHGVDIRSPRALEMTQPNGGVSWDAIRHAEHLLKVTQKETHSLKNSLHTITVNVRAPDSGYRHPHFARANDLESLISMPLLSQDRVVGVINSYAKRPYKFFDREIVLLRNLAVSGGFAFANLDFMSKLEQVSRKEAKSELARDIVHSLTESMSSLVTRLHTISTSVEKIEKSAGKKGAARSNAQQLRRRIDELTEIARTQNNIVSQYRRFTTATRDPKVPIDLALALRNIAAVFSHRADDKKIEFRYQFPSSPPEFTWIEADIYLILLNLVDNAVKFSRKGGRVDLTLEKSQSHILIHVMDFGVGIHPNNQRRIWEPGFSTIAPGAKKKTSGLGLPAVKQTVDRISGASIDLTTRPDQFTKFTLSLPLPQPTRRE